MPKSKNPFIRISPYVWGFSFSAIFIFLLVTAYITDNINDRITNKVIDAFESGCHTTFANMPVNLERCIQKSNEARTFEVINKDICGGCGEKQLCLKDIDLEYCKIGFEQNEDITNLRSTLKSMTIPFTKLSVFTNILIVMGLFVIGFFAGWGIIAIKK